MPTTEMLFLTLCHINTLDTFDQIHVFLLNILSQVIWTLVYEVKFELVFASKYPSSWDTLYLFRAPKCGGAY